MHKIHERCKEEQRIAIALDDTAIDSKERLITKPQFQKRITALNLFGDKEIDLFELSLCFD